MSTKSQENSLAKLALGALGVVYGDIGTSPLYAIKESFNGVHGIAVSPENVLGVLSLFWSLVLVVCVKYIIFMLRANNNGEGGVMALLAMLHSHGTERGRPKVSSWIIFVGLFGAALLYGDGIITPAISVLSAVEGLNVATPVFQPFIVPITVGILIALFLVQSKGTARIGGFFGPITLIWFLGIAAVGLPWIIKNPSVLFAVDPTHGIHLLVHGGLKGFLILGAVVLCITGAEALYADMGHFGIKPIRLAWFWIVFPALIINYFGQGAFLLSGAGSTENPFYSLVPGPLLYPMVILATLATVIASQALISGAYSLTHQAIQLGYLPRMRVVYTSEHAEGQIYVPRLNHLLMLSCMALVFWFRESTNLAAAYGIAVTGTMAVSSILFFSVVRKIWVWPVVFSFMLLAVFLAVDLIFFSANFVKILDGGWVPIAMAAVIFMVMTTWRAGRQSIFAAMSSKAVPLKEFVETIRREKPHRVSGTAVFMTTNMNIAPTILLHHFKHNQVLHQQVVLLTILTEHVPAMPAFEQGRLTNLGDGVFQIIARYGYMQTPHVLSILGACQNSELKIDPKKLSFYLGRETLLTTGLSRMSQWRKKLFVLLSRNAQPATAFFGIPPDSVIEVGLQLEI